MKMKFVLATCAILISMQVPSYAEQKSLRDMTAQERQEFWNSLPDEEKARILARRANREGAASVKMTTEEEDIVSGQTPEGYNSIQHSNGLPRPISEMQNPGDGPTYAEEPTYAEKGTYADKPTYADEPTYAQKMKAHLDEGRNR